MSDDHVSPTHSGLVGELKVVRRRGRGRLRNLDLPVLERVARLVSPDFHDLADVIDKLVERAIAKLGDGQLGQAAKLLFGYTLDKRGAAAGELRDEAARIYGVTSESFRHGAEKTIIDEIATEMLRLIDWDRVSPEAARRGQDEELPADDVEIEERSRFIASANIAVKDASIVKGGLSGVTNTPEDGFGSLAGDEQLQLNRLRLFMAPVPSFVIPRDRLTGEMLGLLAGSDSDQVGVVAVVGAGGFGKTALIMDLCRRPELARLFPDGVLWITVGRDIDDLALASKINDLSEIVCGEKPALVDPLQAGFRLGELLGQRKALLVLDDVWSSHQIRPFLYGARDCRRLMTTRNVTAVPETARQLIVEIMTPQEASQLLTHGLPSPDAIDIEPLVARTWSWPLLIALVKAQICMLIHDRGLTVTEAVAEVTKHLAVASPTVPDVTDPRGRSQAVEATLRASLALLDDRAPRYLELAVFPEDCDIPREVLETYWEHTANWSIPQVHAFCEELTALSLIQTYRAGLARLRLHDVLHDYLRQKAGPGLPGLHAALLEAYRVKHDIAEHGGWWSLPATELYLWSHLFEHLQRAGHHAELHRTATDLRYAVAKIKNKDTLALESDLSTISSEGVVGALRRVIARSSHLLRSDDPWKIIAATLASQLKGHLDGLNGGSGRSSSTPYLEAEWPDALQPDPALYRVLISGADPMSTVSFSPDGQLVAAAGADGALRLWETITGHLRHILIGHVGAINAIAFSPDGELLVSAGSDWTITLWDSATGTLRSTLTGHTASVLAVVFSPRGETIASAGNDGSVRLWATTIGAAVQTWTGHSGPVSMVKFSPDGEVVASASDDKTVRVWDISEGSLRHTLIGHQQAVLTVVFSPDSKTIASASDDGKICLWNVVNGQLDHVLTSSGFWGSAIFSPDGRLVVSAVIGGSHMEATVRVSDTATGSGLHEMGTRGHYPAWECPRYSFDRHRLSTTMAFSSEGNILMATAGDGTINCWHPHTGRELFNLAGHTNHVPSIALSKNGHYLASASWDGSVRLWSMIHATSPGSIPLSWRAGGRITSVACSPARVIAITGSAPGGVQLLTADSDNRETCMLYGLALPHTVAFSRDGNLVASGDNLGRVAIWSLSSDRSAASAMKRSSGSPSVRRLPPGGVINPTVQIGRGEAVRVVVFSPDGRRLVSAGDDGVVRMWGLTYTPAGALTSIQPTAAWPSRLERILALAWSPDGQAVAIGGTDGRVWLHDAPTGSLQRSFAARTSTVHVVAFDPHGLRLAASGPDGALQLWSLATNETHSLAGHQGTVKAVAFCPNKKYLASAAHDGTLRLWSAQSGSFLTGIRIDDTLSGLAWIPATHQLVVVGERGLVSMFSSVET